MTKTLCSLLLLFLATGCISTSDFEAEQRKVAELQDELANVRRTTSSKEDVQSVNARVVEQTETLLKSNAALLTRVGEIEERIQNNTGANEQTNYRIERLLQQLTQVQRDIEDLRARITALQPAPAGEGPVPSSGQVTVPAPAIPSADATQLYEAAYRDYQRGQYDLAIDGFSELLSTYPNSEVADNAAYWIGESLFSQKKYHEAIAQFDSVVNKYPKSDKVPGALLKKGYAYISIGERAQGIVQLQYVLHEHPKSPEASLARQRLKQLGIETN